MAGGSSSDLSDIIRSIYDESDEVAAITCCALALQATAQNNNTNFRGRVRGTKNIQRGVCSWFADYLAPDPVYPPSKFRQAFRVPLKLYWKLHDELVLAEPLFAQKKDAFGRRGHTSHQKILSPLRRLGNGISYNQMDDMCRMSPETQRQYFRLFIKVVNDRFGYVFLNREPELDELRSVISGYEEVGFPGCVGCLDCMHVKWKNCPRAIKGQYFNPKADGKLATISCEALCDRNLYCWHWFPGRCGTNNDITVLDYSPLMNDILSGKRRMTVPEGYSLNGSPRSWLLYMLVDGIYPEWSIFVGPNSAPLNDRELHMTKRQESVRKDIERFFGCLQGRFKILRQERFEWSDAELILITNTCVILHNMLVKMTMEGQLADEMDESGVVCAERDLVEEFFTAPSGYSDSAPRTQTGDEQPVARGLAQLIQRNALVTNETVHWELNEALVDHLWNVRGNRIL